MQPEVGQPSEFAVEEAKRVCAQIWPDRRSAAERARELRRLDLATAVRDEPQPDGTIAFASVWHPALGMIGVIRYATTDDPE